jgi:hypothetical protein
VITNNYKSLTNSHAQKIALTTAHGTVPVPISYRRAILSNVLHVRLILTSHNRLSTYQLQKSATEHFSTYVSFTRATTGLVPISYRRALVSPPLHVSLIPISHNRPSTYQIQRSATEPSSTCKSHSHKPQQV